MVGWRRLQITSRGIHTVTLNRRILDGALRVIMQSREPTGITRPDIRATALLQRAADVHRRRLRRRTWRRATIDSHRTVGIRRIRQSANLRRARAMLAGTERRRRDDIIMKIDVAIGRIHTGAFGGRILSGFRSVNQVRRTAVFTSSGIDALALLERYAKVLGDGAGRRARRRTAVVRGRPVAVGRSIDLAALSRSGAMIARTGQNRRDHVELHMRIALLVIDAVALGDDELACGGIEDALGRSARIVRLRASR